MSDFAKDVDSASIAKEFLKGEVHRRVDSSISSEEMRLMGAAIGDDAVNNLAKEILLRQRQERGGSGAENLLLPKLDIKTTPQERVGGEADNCLPGKVCQLARRHSQSTEFLIGDATVSYDNNSLSTNGLKLMAASWVEGGRLTGLALGTVGGALFFRDLDKVKQSPGMDNTLSLLADGAMISSGLVRALGASGSFSAGLGYVGLGGRLAIGDLGRTFRGDYSYKNNLSLSSDAALFGAGLMKMTAFGPKWLQGGLLAGALVGRAIVPLLPDRIKFSK